MSIGIGNFEGWAEEEFANSYKEWIFDIMEGEGYSILFDFLYDTEFTWSIPQDANRASDGRYLRADFEYDTGKDCPDGWEEWPCSLLELMCSLARTLEGIISYDPEGGAKASDWFWEIASNSGLARFDDEYLLSHGKWAYHDLEETVEKILERDYAEDGTGGFFPLRHSKEDQRYVELWYQLNAYAMENSGL